MDTTAEGYRRVRARRGAVRTPSVVSRSPAASPARRAARRVRGRRRAAGTPLAHHAHARAPRLLEERVDLAEQPGGPQAHLGDRAGLDEAPVGQLASQHPRVRERVHGVAVVADDERRRGERVPLVAMRRHAAEEEPLEERAAGSGVLADSVEDDVDVEGDHGRRDEPGKARHDAHHRRADGHGNEQRRKRDGAAEERVVEDGHLEDHPAEALRGQRGNLQRDVGAQRGAPDDRLVQLEVVEKRHDVTRELAHRVAPHVERPG